MRAGGRFLSWGLVASCLASITAGLAPSASVGAAATTDELVVVAQQFNVPADGSFDISVQVPDELVEALDNPTTDIIVTSYRAIADRPAFLSVLEGTFPRTEDTFDIELAPDPDGVAESPIESVFTRINADTFALRVPTETRDRTGAALQLSQVGVHPIVIELRVDRRRYEATTFVNRLPVDSEPGGNLAVGLLMGQTSMPGIDIDGQPLATVDELSDMAELTDALTAIDANDGDSTTPRAVLIEPTTLRSLESTDPDLARRLVPLLAEGDLLASPRLPLDPDAVAATVPSVTFDPVDLYSRWLREGEDLLDELLPTTVIDRSIYAAGGTLTGSGAAMLRNLGTRLIVLPFDRFAGIDGSTGLFTDTTQLMSVDLGDGTSMPAAVVDPYLAERLDVDGGRALGTAVDIVADLLVMANSIDGSGRFVERHGTILATPDLGVPDAQLLEHLVPLLHSTPGLELVDPADIATRVDVWLIDGRPVTIVPPVQGAANLSSRAALVDTIDSDVDAYGSMLDANDPAREQWNSVVDAIPSSAVSDEQAAQMSASLANDFAALRSGIEVEASSFTLTGRTSTIRFGVRNLTDRTLTVRVQVNSPKIRFPQGDQEVVMAPQSVTDVVAEAEALSNGTSSVFIRVFTPAGPSEESLVPEVVLTARVTSFAGVAQLITVAAVLLIIAWWARHWRRARRTKLAAQHAHHHPALAVRRPTGDGSNELSPDAAASTLPPS